MKFFKNFQDPIETGLHLYLHCPECSGVFLYNGYPSNPIFGIVGCPHCGYLGFGNSFDKGISQKEYTTKCDSVTIISTLVAVLAKEEQMQSVLRVIKTHRNGMNEKELSQIVKNWGCSYKLVLQAIYFGLISQRKDMGSADKLFYHLTEKGSKVLEDCNKLQK